MGWFRPGTFSCIAPCLLQLYYHHQVVQSLQELWYQYVPLLSRSDKQPQNVESAAQLKSSTLSLPLRRQDSSVFKTVESSFGFVKSKTSSKTSLKISPWKKIVEMVMEENELELNIKSARELALANMPKWNFCLKDFREVQENSRGNLGTCGRASRESHLRTPGQILQVSPEILQTLPRSIMGFWAPQACTLDQCHDCFPS